MSNRISAASRVLAGLTTGALLATALTLASAPANAAEGAAPDRDDVLESAIQQLPAPPAGSADRAVRPELVEAVDAPGARSGDAPTARQSAPLGQSTVKSERVVAGATVRGTVTDTAGAPVGGVNVTIYGRLDADPTMFPAGYQITTLADGTWEISGIDTDAADYWEVEYFDPEGRFALQYWNDLSAYYVPTPIELSADAIVESLDATLYRSAAVSGDVAGGFSTAGTVDIYVDLYVYDGILESWVNVDWRELGDGERSYEFASLAPDYYALAATYVSDRGIGLGISDVFEVTEEDVIDVDLVVDRIVVGPDRDFSGDWVSDVLAINSTGALNMYRGNGKAGWAGSSKIGSGWSGMNLAFQAGDFSGDGHSDVIARDNAGDLRLYRGNGAGGWAGSVKIGSGWGGFTSIFSPGDFDGDGNVDVIARNSSGALFLYPGNGAGGWLNRVTIGSGWQGLNLLLGVGDFNSDDTADVVARDGAGRLFLYPGNGHGGWLAKRQIGSGWQNFTAVVAVGDFTSDWAPDLMARDSSGRLFLYAGDGAGGWAGSKQVGSGWGSLRLVD